MERNNILIVLPSLEPVVQKNMEPPQSSFTSSQARLGSPEGYYV